MCFSQLPGIIPLALQTLSHAHILHGENIATFVIIFAKAA